MQQGLCVGKGADIMSGRIKHILFVCTGNICRSPFAEGLLKKLVQKKEKSHAKNLLDAFPEAEGKVFLIRRFARFGSKNRGVADPYGLNYEAYRFCFLDIQDCISGLAEHSSLSL
jgi:protein-tyrosine-phosphatase